MTDDGFETLLAHLLEHRGFDFTGYKRPSLRRRVHKRVDELGLSDYVAYQDHLEVHPDEYDLLFDTILINVTSFFRDPESWSVLEQTALPAVLASPRTDRTVRIWSAGCATGEEPYSIVMAVVAALGRDEAAQRLKVFATDIDERALATARAGCYRAEAFAAVPPERVDACFEATHDGYRIRPDLRRCVIFGRHDLTADAPISHVDLIVCRNTIMYLDARTQDEVASRFCFALDPGKYLFLGRAETMLSHRAQLAPLDQRHRIYQRAHGDAPDRALAQLMAQLEMVGADPARVDLVLPGEPDDPERLRQHLLKLSEDVATASEELRSTNEELATANEELQSTNEELETTNEELQSTNDELQSTNDELGSANGALGELNHELQQQVREADRLAVLLAVVSAHVEPAIAVLDEHLRVQLWSPAAASLWGAPAAEVIGTDFLGLRVGLPVDELGGILRDALVPGAPATEVELAAVDADGVGFACVVRCEPFDDEGRSIRSLVVRMDRAAR